MLCALCAQAYILTIFSAVFGIFSQLYAFVNIDLTITGYNGKSVTVLLRDANPHRVCGKKGIAK